MQREIRDFNGRIDDDDYCVDLAMLTWHNFREPEQPPGVSPGPVGRRQRRFIVWHSVPKGLETPEQFRAWLVEVLPETERLVREYLPTKSKMYPADQLADEVVALRDHLAHQWVHAHRHDRALSIGTPNGAAVPAGVELGVDGESDQGYNRTYVRMTSRRQPCRHHRWSTWSGGC